MQQAGDAALAAAVESSDRTIIWKLEVDWARDGNYAHPLSDLTKVAESIVVDRDINSSVPSEASLIEGYLTAQLQITVSGTRPGDTEPIARLLSPWNENSSLFGEGRLAVPVRADFGHRLPTGVETQVRQFTGFISQFSADSRTGDVRIVALDPSDGVRGPISLPLWALETGSSTTKAQDWRINSQWVIDYVLRRNGIYMSPPPMPGCFFSVTGHGSFVPEIGHNAFQDAWISLGYTTPEDQVYYPGRPGWGLAYGGSPMRVGGFYARGLPGFRPEAGRSISFQAQIDFDKVATIYPGAVGGWCHYFSDSAVLGGSQGIRISNRIDRAGKLWMDIYNPSTTLLMSLGGPTFPLTGWQDVWVRLDIKNPLNTSTVTFKGQAPVTINLSSLSTTAQIWEHPMIAYSPSYPIHDLQVCDATGLAAGATIYDVAGWVPQADLDPGLNDLSGLPLRRGVGSWDLIKEVVAAEYGVVGFSEAGRPFFKNRDTLRRQNLTVEKTLTNETLITDLALSERTGSVRNRITASVVSRRIQNWNNRPWQVVFRLSDPGQIVAPPGISQHIIQLDSPAWVEDGLFTMLWQNPINWPPTDLANAGKFTTVRQTDSTSVSGVTVRVVTLPDTESDHDLIMIEVFNPDTFAVIFATPADQSPAFWMVGRPYSDEPVPDIDLSVSSSIARYGERVLEMPRSDWVQRPESALIIGRSLLKDLRASTPIVERLEAVGDVRLQLQDAALIQDTGVLGGPVMTSITGISRQLTADPSTGAAALVDKLDVRPFAAPGKWILGHDTWSRLGQTTRM